MSVPRQGEGEPPIETLLDPHPTGCGSAAAHRIDVMCCGGATVDRLYRALQPVRRETSNPVSGRQAFGGVALNVAVNLAAFGVRASLVSAVGDDANGNALLCHLRGLGIETDGVIASAQHPTAEYLALVDTDGTLAIGLADMAVLADIRLPAPGRISSRPAPAWVFADCNLSAALLQELVASSPWAGAHLALDAVSVAKSSRLPKTLEAVDLLFLNGDEAAAYLGRPQPPDRAVASLRDKGAKQVVLTLGAGGVLVCSSAGELRHLSAQPAEVVDVTGAGDALIAATLAHLLAGHDLFAAAGRGTLAAARAVERIGSVRPDMSLALLEEAPCLPPSGPARSHHPDRAARKNL